ncbi:MAG TPA: D-alanine--D-alanine ligase [Ignavibacteriaceae bacterium]|nr:D-alanine--D-alanine ligase [Ignavibacteriaceae bacterium]
MNNPKLRIALLVGGASPEREVSKLSSLSIYNALISLGYEVVLIDPAYGKNQPDVIEAFFSKKDFSEISSRNYIDAINSNIFDKVDLAFLGLHGKWGEDGTIQSLLEFRGIKYTGSNVIASANAMDKAMSKVIFRYFNINTADWLVYDKKNINTGLIKKDIETGFGYPCVIKPNDQGSTVGLTVCKESGEVEKAVQIASQFSDKVLIEDYIDGRELTVAIINNEAMPVLEIKPKHDLYDYECKYTTGMSEYVVPADIPKHISKKIQGESLKVFNKLGCSVYGRIDFKLSSDNQIYCFEANTLPGMTSTSLVPKMAKAIGVSFDELIDRIIKLSI